MRKVMLLMAFLIGTTTAYAATEIGKEGYADAVKTGVSIVEFYSPSCPHCKKMEPLIKTYESGNPEAKILKFNVDGEKDFVMSKGVQSWPTFIIYKDGSEIFRFKGSMEYAKFERLASIDEKPTQAELIDFRVMELEEEQSFLMEKGNAISQEIGRINARLNQLPAAIEELKRLRADQMTTPDCPSGSCS